MKLFSRREMLTSSVAVAGLAMSPGLLWKGMAAAQDNQPYTLPRLPYAANALEPHIDARTMEIHHGRHHRAYVDGLNAAVADQPALARQPEEQLLRNIQRVPANIRQRVINMGGGHANHTLFWDIMGPNAGGQPAGDLAQAINRTFESFNNFKTQFSQAALGQFGSGWAWLVVNNGNLEIIGSANQDSPLMQGKTPILGIDVWEHAYYLHYQNRRADYVNAWWNVVNWGNVARRYGQARQG